MSSSINPLEREGSSACPRQYHIVSPPPQDQAIADLTGYEDAATLRWPQACVQAANNLTALPNGRYVNVRMERMRQGLELAQRGAREHERAAQDRHHAIDVHGPRYQRPGPARPHDPAATLAGRSHGRLRSQLRGASAGGGQGESGPLDAPGAHSRRADRRGRP